MKGIVPAAGLGTRFLPVTKAQPKEMLPVFDKPVIQYVIEEAVASGIEDILIITGRGKRAIEDHFDRSFELEELLKERGQNSYLAEVETIPNLAMIHYIRQKSPRGLGDSVLQAEFHIGNEPFAILLGDIITISNQQTSIASLQAIYERFGSSVIAVERVNKDKVESFGIIQGKEVEEGLFLIEDLVEKPKISEAPSDLAIFGRYVLTPTIFSCLKRTAPGKGDEIQLTDAIKLLLDEEKVYAYMIDQIRFDIGNKIDWIKASITLALLREEYSKELRDWLRSFC